MRALMVFFIGLFIFGRVHAHNLDADQCLGEARDGITFSEYRDLGIPLEVAVHNVEEAMAQVYGSEKSYVKDEDDLKRAMKLVLDVWASPMTGGEIYDAIRKDCNKPVLTKLPKGVVPKGPQIES